MGDMCPGSTPGAELYFGMQPATQVDSAFYPLWDGKMSTSQTAVIDGVRLESKGRHDLFAGKTVLPYLSALENALVIKGALGM